MADGFNFKMRQANAYLRYEAHGGSIFTAQVRVSRVSYTYGVTSTESHTRTHRAFYPHRRALGQFMITVDAKGYREYRHFMNWMRAYAEYILEGQIGSRRAPVLMEVRIPARRFHKIGMLASGVDEHDHVGSNVFSPQLVFMTLQDLNDPGTSLKALRDVSIFEPSKVDPSGTVAFYPASIADYKDTQSKLYDLGTLITPVDPLPHGTGGPNRAE
jgi:hypothetical protein